MNIQTVPRKDKIVKAAFFPKLDCLLFADYSQIEYRLFAYYLAVATDDWSAVEVFKAGRDIHAETARDMLTRIGRVPGSTLSDDERQVGKSGNFAAVYAGGIPTIQRQLGCDKSTARALSNAFHERYPTLGRWTWKGRGFENPDPDTLNGQLSQRILERGYITTLWGRHLHPVADRLALNSLCQGGAADLMKQAMVNIYHGLKAEGCESHMVLSVHDEIGLDCRESEREFITSRLPDWMGDETLQEVLPVEVDLKLSYTSWAEAEDIGG